MGKGSASDVLATRALGPELGTWSPHRSQAQQCLSVSPALGGLWSSLARHSNPVGKLSQ